MKQIWKTGAFGGRITFSELLDAWLETEKARCKASTYAAYAQRAEKHLRPVLGEKRLRRLSAEDLRLVCDAMEPLSPATQQGVLCVLRQILDFGRERGFETGIPTDQLRQPPEKNSVTVLTGEEIARLEEVLHAEGSLRGLGLRLCLYTGLRLGEVCALRWSDLSPDGKTLRIERTVQRLRNEDGPQRTALRLDTPKSGSSRRSVPVPDALAAELNACRGPADSYLLTGTVRSMDPRTYQFYFQRVLRQAEIRQVNFHILRHTFATRCIDLGLDAKSLSRVLGHSDVSTTLNIYVHPDQRRLRACQEQMMAEYLPGSAAV